MKDGYHIYYDEDWLASFATCGEARDYISHLANGGDILGTVFPRFDLFKVIKGMQRLTVETRIEVTIGGY